MKTEINVYKQRQIPGHEEKNWRQVQTPYGRLGEVIKTYGNTPRLEDWKPGQKWVIGHRGFVGKDKTGTTRPENTQASLRAAYECGVRLAELDFSVDAVGKVGIFHDKRTDRWLPREGDFRKERVSEWIEELQEYVDGEIVDGRLKLEGRKRTGQHILWLDEIQAKVLNELPGLMLLADCRDDEPPIITATISHMTPEVYNRIYIQVLNFGTKGVRDFVEQVEKLKPHKDWKKNLKFVISPNPGAYYWLAGVDEHEITLENGFSPVWEWTRSFLDEKLRVCAFHIPQTGAGRFLITSKRAYHPAFGMITQRPNLTPFIVDKIAMKLIEKGRECFPDLPTLSPSAFNTWTSGDGIHYHSSFHYPLNLSRLDPQNATADYFFLHASKPETHFEADIDIIVTDDIPASFYYLAMNRMLGPVAITRGNFTG